MGVSSIHVELERMRPDVRVPFLDEPYPCDGCRKYDFCRAHKQACAAFSRYLSPNTTWQQGWPEEPREPENGVYVRIYGDT